MLSTMSNTLTHMNGCKEKDDEVSQVYRPNPNFGSNYGC
jgi:hypothetical protein